MIFSLYGYRNLGGLICNFLKVEGLKPPCPPASDAYGVVNNIASVNMPFLCI